jgi:hypothetical protein
MTAAIGRDDPTLLRLCRLEAIDEKLPAIRHIQETMHEHDGVADGITPF